DQAQALAGEVIDHHQDAEPPTIGQRVRGKVERPTLVRSLRQRHRRPCAQSALATTTPTHLQSLLAIQPPQPLVVHADPLPFQQQLQTPPAKPTAVGRQFLQPHPCHRVIHTPMAVAHRATIGADDRTGPPLTDPVRLTRSGHSSPLSGGRHHFRDVMSFSTALSSIASASSFFSFAFSSSSCRSRLASETLMPPNF